jgi:hypothetical protein
MPWIAGASALQNGTLDVWSSLGYRQSVLPDELIDGVTVGFLRACAIFPQTTSNFPIKVRHPDLAISSKSGRRAVNQKAQRIPKWEMSASPSAFGPMYAWLTDMTECGLTYGGSGAMHVLSGLCTWRPSSCGSFMPSRWPCGWDECRVLFVVMVKRVTDQSGGKTSRRRSRS